jgi:uncharacterized membrane protein YeiH
MAGTRSRLDIYGVLVLSFVASSFGGITRDVLIGAIPPAALRDWRYLAVSVAAGVLVFAWPAMVRRLRSPVHLLDAAGLAFFCVSGAQKALSFGLSPVMAALLGMVTGVGGGMVRDVLLAEIPTILRSELYAVAALAGASAVVLADRLQLPYVVGAILGGLLCFCLRVVAIRRGWRLPTARDDRPGRMSDDR